MAKISLRAYNRDIEALIDHGQTEQAIAHCKYILKQYPKHIDTYRLLGKTYLESQRYTEAADVLQRVLAVIPDDFVSHLGMSIIREDEGDLDDALWHMERAFEIQPSNNAIQDELRRLYGRRDGIEPPRVRLTRGALVRMYARGELFPQAIAEARAAIAEDPTRVDLEVILAHVYYTAGQKVEATETCSRLVNKMPYCLEANRLLAEILPGTTRAEDAKAYQQTVTSIDPYSAFLSRATPRSEDVPDNAVMVEQLIYEGSTEETSKPEWAQSVGADLGEAEPALPEWMDSISQHDKSSQAMNAAQGSPVFRESSTPIQEPPPVESIPPAEKAELIPDWMSDAGWKPGSGEEVFDENAQVDESQIEPSPDVAPAEIPDWLKSLAPDDEVNAAPTAEEQESLERLKDILPAAEEQPEQVPAIPAAVDLIPAAEEPEELPSWLQNIKDDDIPSSAASYDVVIDHPTEISQPEAAISYPEQVSQVQEQPAIENAPDSEESITGWLHGLGFDHQTEDIQATGAIDAFPEETEKTTSAPASRPDEKVETASGENEIDAAMAWLESLAARHGADEETLFVPPTERQDTPPEWVNEDKVMAAVPVENPPVSEPVLDEMPEPQANVEIPAPEAPTGPSAEIEPVIPEQSQPESMAAAPVLTPQTDEDIDAAMAWLESLAAKNGADENELTVKPEERQDTPPDWIRSQLETAPAQPAAPEEHQDALPDWMQSQVETAPTQPAKPISSPADMDSNALTQPIIHLADEDGKPADLEMIEQSLEATAPLHLLNSEGDLNTPSTSAPGPDLDFAWLESLAARQGANEEELLTKPDDRVDQPPAWADAQEAIGIDQQPVIEAPQAETIPPAAEVEALAEETQTLEPVAQVADQQIPPAEEENVPDWLNDLVSEQPTEPESGAEAFPTPETAAENEWIEQPEAEKPAAGTTAEFVPEGKVKSEALSIQPTMEEIHEKDLDLPDWLSSLANEAGTSEVATVDSGTIEPASQQPIDDEADASVSEAMPDWLQNITDEETEAPEEQTIFPEPVQMTDPTAEVSIGQVTPTEPEIPMAAEAEETPIIVSDQITEPTAPAEDLTQPIQVGVAQPEQTHQTETEPVAAAQDQIPTSQVEPALEPAAAVQDQMPTSQGEPEPEPAAAVQDQIPTSQVELAPETAAIVQDQIPTSQVEPAATVQDQVPTSLVEPAPEPAAAVQEQNQPSPIEPASGLSGQSLLEAAKSSLNEGKVENAVSAYSQLIEQDQELDAVITDIRSALYRYPVDISLWQTLGDAYYHNNRVQDALDSYTKAEELLR